MGVGINANFLWYYVPNQREVLDIILKIRMMSKTLTLPLPNYEIET